MPLAHSRGSSSAQGPSKQAPTLRRGAGAQHASSITHPPSFLRWSKPVVVVVSHYNEWQSSVAAWARPAPSEFYEVVTSYQRKDPVAPGYIANFGHEASLYLRFVAAHTPRALQKLLAAIVHQV